MVCLDGRLIDRVDQAMGAARLKVLAQAVGGHARVLWKFVVLLSLGMELVIDKDLVDGDGGCRAAAIGTPGQIVIFAAPAHEPFVEAVDGAQCCDAYGMVGA
jgi:hypothetical protein